MQRLAQAPVHRRTLGFIQGALLVGLALVVMVAAGLALANRDALSTTQKEEARLAAAVMMKQAVDLKTSLVRAVHDGMSPTSLSALRAQGYLSEIPSAPRDSASNSTPAYADTVYTAAVAGLGGAGSEVYLLATPVSDEVCRRLNGALHGSASLPVAADASVNVSTGAISLANGWVGRGEACAVRAAGSGNDNVYFKVAVVR